MTSHVEIRTEHGANIMRLTRPDKKNALTSQMYAEMNAAIAAAEANPDVATHVFLGSGGVFTAGNDMADFLTRAQGRADVTTPVLDFVLNLPAITKPMIAAVDGLAVGVGATLLLHCDLVYATPETSLRTPFVDLGLIPEAGSSLLGPMRLGYARAFEFLVMGEPMSAEQALTAGLVNRIVAANELEPTARDAAQKLASKPPEALAASRRILRGDPSATIARIKEEFAILDRCFASDEAREAFSAFLEKRAPTFKRAGSRS